MMCHVMESVQKKPFAVSFCSLAIFSLTSSYFLRGFPAFFIYEELSCSCFEAGHDMENGPGYPWFQFFWLRNGAPKKLSPGLGQVEGKTIPHRALEKKTPICATQTLTPGLSWILYIHHWFCNFCLNNVCQCCWVQIQRLPDELVIKWPVGLFRNWGARKLHKFLIISQWNRLQFLAQNHSWTTASYGWLYNFTVHLLYNI